MTVMTIGELEQIIGRHATLAGTRVEQPYPNVAPLQVRISGAVYIHGLPHFWETDLDLSEITTREDIDRLVGLLLGAIAKAEKSPQL